METRGFRVRMVGLVAMAMTLVGLAALAATPAASTGIGLTAKDGACIFARTMQYDTNLQTNVLVVPRNRAFTGTRSRTRPDTSGPPSTASSARTAINRPGLATG